MTNKPNDIEVEYSDEFSHLAQFLDDVFKMDQSASNHMDNATKCLKLLIVRQKEFEGTPLERFFWNSASFESFHIAQKEALDGNYEAAKKYLSQSILAAQKGISEEWLAYLKGTKFYLESDIDGLQKEISKAGINQKVLERLLNGYKKRGSVDYAIDYQD